MGDIATGETATCGTSIPAAIQIDSSIIFSRIKQLEAVSLGHPILPLSRLPPIPDKTDAAAYAEFQLKIDVLASFFLQRGVVSPDFPSHTGETPLLIAVRIGSGAMIQCLHSHGADVNRFGRTQLPDTDAGRTPLQLAATLGNLALVKLLIEECGADDRVVAPDGALAYRLAAANCHDDVVAYLPIRRGGMWLRWKKRSKLVEKAGKGLQAVAAFIAIFVWIIPRKIFYEFPKSVWKGDTVGMKIRSGIHRAWEVIVHLSVLICLMLYELPKQAILGLLRRLNSVKKRENGP
ncbi:ankyrin repeat-containing domain protein [Ilyonectria robusta]|uniref:ankyrin repeat-containing domain protein n=1 Tax=Ilyonectria robusta TaxID=1079257 RepID=UPI001E8E7C73|nr:ankyrin repeat-containing domain protein [Ilyonectria robusta]KAH8672340.1 ankyrin repeat-containing domain protein [Ilyonectria robusta]